MFPFSHMAFSLGSSLKFCSTIGVRILPRKSGINDQRPKVRRVNHPQLTWTQSVDTDGFPIDNLAPFHGETTSQLADGCLGRVVDGRGEATIGNETRHAGDQQDGSTAPILDHLAGTALGGAVHALVVDVEHLHDFFWRVVERRLDQLHASGCNQAIHPLMFARDLGDDSVHVAGLAHVDLVKVQ